MLRFFDLYGPKIHLSFQNSVTYKTNFGGILTILTILILISSTIILSISLLSRDNFKVITCTTFDSNSSYDFSHIPILFGFRNSEDMLLSDKRLFNLRLIDNKFDVKLTENDLRSIKIINKEFEYENCEKYRNNNSYFINNTFSNYNLSLFQCVKPGQNLTFYGKHGDLINGFRNLLIIVEKCNNETLKLKNENITCYGEEEINKKLSGIKLILLYVSYNLNHYSFDGKHIFLKESGEYFNFQFPDQKAYSISFSKNIYITDKSMLFNFKEKTEFFSYSSTSNNLDSKNINYVDIQSITDDTVGAVLFNMDGYITEYNRSYEKIMSLLVNLGGIYNLIIAVFKLITKFTTNKMKIIDLIKEISLRTYNIKREKKYSRKKVLNNQTKSNMNLINNENKEIFVRQSYLNSAHNVFDRKNFSINIKNNIKNSSENISQYKDKNEIYKTNNNNKIILENIKKIGVNIIWFYICPFSILKNFRKFNQISKLYMLLIENLSVEKLFAISNKWSITERFINDSNNSLIKYYNIKELPITTNSFNDYQTPVFGNIIEDH